MKFRVKLFKILIDNWERLNSQNKKKTMFIKTENNVFFLKTYLCILGRCLKNEVS